MMTMIKENFHTHSIYCDGKNIPEEMVKAAVNLGFNALGFSGHCKISRFESNWSMSDERTNNYINAVTKLREEYKDKINIYIGTELDYFSDVEMNRYDYTIASVHYLNQGGEQQPIDTSLEIQQRDADKFFGGSLIDYSVDYYRYVGDILNKFDADIIGHFDLVTKFNEADCAFDTKDKKYINAWHDAVDALIPFNKPFEINTGAIARGYRKTPYPAFDIADYIAEKGGYFIVTSDCHDCRYLDCNYTETFELYKKYDIISFDEYLINKENNND